MVQDVRALAVATLRIVAVASLYMGAGLLGVLAGTVAGATINRRAVTAGHGWSRARGDGEVPGSGHGFARGDEDDARPYPGYARGGAGGAHENGCGHARCSGGGGDGRCDPHENGYGRGESGGEDDRANEIQNGDDDDAENGSGVGDDDDACGDAPCAPWCPGWGWGWERQGDSAWG